MRHIDLFSGIGSFALAAQYVWFDDYECVAFCDHDWFCQQVLTKNFPGVPIYGDIKTLTDTASEGLEGSSGAESPLTFAPGCADLITGGFPCQPFSSAGRRRGTDDNRYLWPQMFRVIQLTKPTWVIAENVFGFTTWQQGLVLEQVCSDLESENYEVQSFVIPAAGIGAPHRRDRIWIIAHSLSPRSRDTGGDARREKRPALPYRADRLQPSDGSLRPSWPEAAAWERDWREVALERCVLGVDDGAAGQLVRLPDSSTITQARLRREGLKAIGNAIVPAVAVEIMKAIKAAGV